MREAWQAWAGVVGVNWFVWLMITVTSADAPHPWPLWVMVPWGIGPADRDADLGPEWREKA